LNRHQERRLAAVAWATRSGRQPREYAEEVRQGRFPAAEHTYSR
jgi:ketopantoate hydroxymethyltransferase